MSRRQSGCANTVILVPCYNESKRLPVESFVDFLTTHPNFTVLFVNDGSRDNTDQTLESIQQQVGSDQVHILSLSQNGGKAEAIRQGMLLALSSQFQLKYAPSLIGYMDADLATPLTEIQRMIDIASRRKDLTLVVGSRLALRGHNVVRTPSRKLLGKLFATAVSVTLGIGLRDTQCGAKLFRNGEYLRTVFKEKFSDRWLFDVEILSRLRADYAAEIYECPLEQWQDVGNSRLRTRDFMVAPWKLCQLTYTYRVKPACLRWIKGIQAPALVDPLQDPLLDPLLDPLQDPAVTISRPIRADQSLGSLESARKAA